MSLFDESIDARGESIWLSGTSQVVENSDCDYHLLEFFRGNVQGIKMTSNLHTHWITFCAKAKIQAFV